MQFLERLREPIRRGEITCSVRMWQSPRVKVGGRYRLAPGYIRVTSIREIWFEDVSPELARRSGFEGTVDLFKIARHGPGRTLYLIEFEYEAE